MKVKVSWTIEEDIANWLRDSGNASEMANDILRKVKAEIGDVNQEYIELQNNRKIVYEKERNFFVKIEKQFEEGNKQEREEAEKILRLREERDKEEKEKMTTLSNILKEAGFLEDLLIAKDIFGLFELNKKIAQKEVKNPLSKIGSFSVLLLREIAEYHNHFIPLNSPIKKEGKNATE